MNLRFRPLQRLPLLATALRWHPTPPLTMDTIGLSSCAAIWDRLKRTEMRSRLSIELPEGVWVANSLIPGVMPGFRHGDISLPITNWWSRLDSDG